jgi:hypothetical protein
MERGRIRRDGLSQTAAEFILSSYTGFMVKGQRRSQKGAQIDTIVSDRVTFVVIVQSALGRFRLPPA